jgi:hypothetical protein
MRVRPVGTAVPSRRKVLDEACEPVGLVESHIIWTR